MHTRELTQEDIQKWYDALPPDDRFELPRDGGQLALALTEDDNEREHIIPHASIIEAYYDTAGWLNLQCYSVSYTFSTRQASDLVDSLLRPYMVINDRRQASKAED